MSLIDFWGCAFVRGELEIMASNLGPMLYDLRVFFLYKISPGFYSRHHIRNAPFKRIPKFEFINKLYIKDVHPS